VEKQNHIPMTSGKPEGKKGGGELQQKIILWAQKHPLRAFNEHGEPQAHNNLTGKETVSGSTQKKKNEGEVHISDEQRGRGFTFWKKKLKPV